MTPTTLSARLHIVHSLGGGSERWWQDFCIGDADNTHFILRAFHFDRQYGAGLLLYASQDLSCPIEFWPFDHPFAVTVTTHAQYKSLLKQLIAQHAVGSIIVSSLIGHSLDVLDTGLPTVVEIHDFFPVCPAINAHFRQTCTYCDDNRLRECAVNNPPEFNPFIDFTPGQRIEVRQRYLELLTSRRVALVAPSFSAREQLLALVPSQPRLCVDVISHGYARWKTARLPAPVPASRLRVLVLGSLSAVKGFELLMNARSALSEFADLHFVGAGPLGRFFEDTPGATVIAEYRLDDLPQLVANSPVDVGLLASVCSETFSYALTELHLLGIAPVATNVGSFRDRIVDGETGFLFAPNSQAMTARLRGLHANPERLVHVRARIADLQPRTLQAMAADYRDLLIPAAPTVADVRPQAPEPQLATWARAHAVKLGQLERSGARLRHEVEIQQVRIRERNQQLADLQTAMRHRGHELALLNERLGERDAQLQERDARLQERDAQLRERDAQLQERDAQLQERDVQLQERTSSIDAQRLQVQGQALQIISLQLEVQDQQARLEESLSQRRSQQFEIESQLARVGALDYQLNALYQSSSWTITRPLRFFARVLRGDHAGVVAGLRHPVQRLGKRIHRRLPRAWRQPLVEFAYRHAGSLFQGLNHFESWRARGAPGMAAAAARQLGTMVDIDEVLPLAAARPGRIAIHAHIFYADVAEEFAQQLAQMPFPYTLFVSVADNAAANDCQQRFRRLPLLDALTVEVVPNRGRDIAPMLCAFGARLQGFDFIAHIQSKKSLYNGGRTQGWREYLVHGLLGSPERIKRIFTLLQTPGIGLVYPQTYVDVPYQAHTWLANRGNGALWCQRLGIANPPGYFDFPVGSMFWARTDALRPLFEAGIELEAFEVEANQTDGTLAHCMERMLGLVTRATGHSHAILRDTANQDASKWRFGQFHRHTFDGVLAMLTAPHVRAVIFDVFDTLLVRPLTDPELVKQIVARRAGSEAGKLYLAGRAAIESQARAKAGRDVDLDAIYREWKLHDPAIRAHADRLKALEIEVERASVQARPEMTALLQAVARAGKRVLLASDTFLPRPVLDGMLQEHGITGWDKAYLSCEVGLRKDSGDLYRHLLKLEGLDEDQVVMVGDNERSDFQIPSDMGMPRWHLLRPVELARSRPRWTSLIEGDGDVDSGVTLGLLARERFAPIFYPDPQWAEFAPRARDIGFQVVGPLTLAFASWLGREASALGIGRLHFLAREGALLKAVYDRWHAAGGTGPDSAYLVLSRRAVTVPMLETLSDIHALARPRFYPNDLDMFLRERYGFMLNDQRWRELESSGLWRRGRPVEVDDQDIREIEPVLAWLAPAILKTGADERVALLSYLDAAGLNSSHETAVVDVGYSGTIQSRLIRLLKRRVHGFYFITNTNCKNGDLFGDSCALGCYADGVAPGSRDLGLYRHAFEVEKLLSASEEQVLHYEMVPEGSSGRTVARPRHRVLADMNPAADLVRAEVQRGAFEFVSEAGHIRNGLLPDFTVAPALASRLFDSLLENLSPAEDAILRSIVLDDFYCGRGLVA